MGEVREGFTFNDATVIGKTVIPADVVIDYCKTLSGVAVTGTPTIVEQGVGDYVMVHPNITERTMMRGHLASDATKRFVVMLDPVDGDIAKETTLAASVTVIQTDIASLLTSIIASGGIGGIITGVVDAGVMVSSSFRPISMEKGEKKVLVYEIKENNVAIDVSAYTFQFGVKRDLYDTTYAFAAIAGAVTANADGVMSIVTFIIPAASTKALTVIESGRYSVGMYDGTGNKAALTPPGGVEFRLTEDILDVA